MNRDQAAWQAQSLLIGYPDGLTGRLGTLRRVADAIDQGAGAPMRAFVEHAQATPEAELAASYVATFDHRKRCCLYLTYYGYGDTRKRGMALLALKRRYAGAGLELTDDELPDHLAVMLEYAAAVPAPAGLQLLARHRAGIELLRLALHDARSPWAAVLDSIAATLPPLRGGQLAAVARLAAEGPPDEQVGLDPFPAARPASQGASR